MKIDYNAHPCSTSKIGWIKKESLLISLQEQLFAYGLIECSLNPFRRHFLGSPIKKYEYIKWLGTTTQLLYMYDLLIRNKCIPDHRSNRHKNISDHFINRLGNTLNNKSLRSLFNQLREDSDGSSMIREIFIKLGIVEF